MVKYLMPKIHILPENLRNKIAAGEVVERPASVVKELVENSIDAEASKIIINIAKAGKRLISVSDNGYGMDKEDVLLSFERYATSKIVDEKDLFNIKTMGFRGEALSSIAAVSKVAISTAQAENIGTCVEIAGGEMKAIRDCSTSGTTIEIKDLFYNTPARRKFLKSDITENHHIIDVVTRASLCNYKIGFNLKIDESEVLTLPPAKSLKERIVQLFGMEFTDGLFEISHEASDMAVTAFIGKDTNLRNNRNSQFIFINNRPVKDPSIAYAVYKYYEGAIPKDRHPVFFIFLYLSPYEVDFNVHPAKREVRFADKTSVFNFVYQAIKNKAADIININKSAVELVQNPNALTSQYPDSSTIPQVFSMAAETQSLYENEMPQIIEPIYLGETFIAFAAQQGLTILDYHAAHERINYERLLSKSGLEIHRLLFPEQATLAASDYRIILQNIALLEEFGIDAEDFGNGSIMIRSLPYFLKGSDIKSLLSDIAAVLLNSEAVGETSDNPVEAVKKNVAARIACHSSIRGREVPDGVRLAELLNQLSKTDNPERCPHGRPTKIFMSKSDLRKMFKKT
jgi:DNA mismatch repair protein MutL